MEWRGIDPTNFKNPARGERILSAGGPDKDLLELSGRIFCKNRRPQVRLAPSLRHRLALTLRRCYFVILHEQSGDARNFQRDANGMNATRKGFTAVRKLTSRRARPVVLLGLILASASGGCGRSTSPTDDASWSLGVGPPLCPGPVVHVIAVENQYGSLVSPLGGQGVRFKSIITNPDADPHEFQTNFRVVQDYQNAQLVVENGLGYDDFSDKILATIPRTPEVLNAGDVLGLKLGDNPHVWYDPQAIDRLCQAITAALEELNPAGAEYFDARARDYADRLAPYHEAVARIRKRFAGTPVGATESIFVPMARATGLDLISPPGLMNAVAEDANPSVRDVDFFQRQIRDKKIKVLIYNNQTSGSLTSRFREMAEKAGIRVVGVSETLTPVNATFESWQMTQLRELEDALASATGQ
jgi:zinc/manganese transport system substrate-binding protein